MANLIQAIWNRAARWIPSIGFHFDRPIVLLQSDDWGRVGLRDQEGLGCLRSAGLTMGEHPYDLYTLETAEDLGALQAVLRRHRDSTGYAACVGMNFVLANLNFAKMEAEEFRQIYLLPLAEGLPQGWSRPGLLEAYRAGIDSGVFRPALHGMTHFCRVAVERQLCAGGDRASLLRTLWRAGTPYIHWRMPWIGYEFWDPERTPEQRFLLASAQQEVVGHAVEEFNKLFSSVPQSACAPGYRSNDDTLCAWAQYGIRVVQSGPGTLTPPHLDRHSVLHIYRTVEFEPATDPSLSVENCIGRAEGCFDRGIPAIVSIHSINFHSSVSGYRDRTLQLLDQFLTALEARHSNLLYVDDEALSQLIEQGFYQTPQGTTRVNVTKRQFTRREVAQNQRVG